MTRILAAILALLFVVQPRESAAAGCRLPGRTATCPAPAGGAFLIWRKAELPGASSHTLILHQPVEGYTLVRTFERSLAVEVLWSPDGRAAAITDHLPGGESTVWVLAGRALSRQNDIGERLDREEPGIARRRLVADRWLDDARLAVSLLGDPTDRHERLKITYTLSGELETDASNRMDRGVIGLLELPDILGNPDTCTPTAPATAPVYREPSAREPFGVIRVTRVAAPDPNGGCRPADVRLTIDGKDTRLPVAEHAYEAESVIVLERRGDWFRIKLPAGSGWVAPASDRTFHPLEDLISPEHLTYLTAHWDGLLRATPGGRSFRPGQPPAPGDTVTVVRVSRAGKQTWVLVETSEGCGGEPLASWKPERGWVPLHDADGHSNFWFYSRGC